MRRREFVALLGGSAAAWPFRAHAQKPSASVGFIHASAADRSRDVVAAFEDGLRQAGYPPGDTLTIEYRWANDDYDRLPRLAPGISEPSGCRHLGCYSSRGARGDARDRPNTYRILRGQ